MANQDTIRELTAEEVGGVAGGESHIGVNGVNGLLRSVDRLVNGLLDGLLRNRGGSLLGGL